MPYEVKLKMAGKESDAGRIDVNAFITELSRLRDALVAVDKLVSREGKNATDFAVGELTHSSPATVTFVAIPKEDSPDIREEVLNTFWSGIRRIQDKGELPDRFDSSMLTTFEHLVDLLGKDFEEISLSSNGHEYALTSTLKGNVEKILGPPIHMHTSIRGMLDALNIHEPKREFRLYPLVGPTKVTCYVPREKLEEAIRGIGKYVSVSGEAAYNRVDRYPTSIRVQDIEVYQEQGEEAPKLASMQGVAPDATGGLSSEEFIRKLRNEWQ